jgi:DNA-binding winged helix-turn-helix (wHTH) protein/tetratricopeptide (TPR) repeat protein
MSAGADQKPKQLYEFGPFRVDAEKELLLRGEENVPLTPKTFQILLVLMRHNKEVVTKDDLLKFVWPDTFVEEANLSRNIFLLRKALGESPQDHQYVVTVPGRGYRFAEDVRLVADQELSIVAASHAKVQVEVSETKPWPWIAGAVVLLIAVSVGAFWLFFRGSPKLTSNDTVVLADFSNSTGDPVFDGTLRQGLAVQLEQSPFLNLISDRRIQGTLRLMNQPADARITGQTAQEICERTGSAAVVEGSIGMLGANYVIGLRAKNCGNGEVLGEEQSEVSRKEDVLKALDDIASKLRGLLGESLSSVQKYSTPLDEATTPSLEALKAYSTGVKVAFTNGYEAGIPHFKRAIEIDPNFAMAHAHLGLWYSSVGESELARESAIRAYELRDRANDREKFFITAMYQRDVTGNLEAGHQTLELWVATYPHDSYVHGLLSGFCSQGTGRYAQSIEEAKQALAIDPDFTPAYINLGFSHFYLDRLGEAKNIVAKALGRKMNVPEILVLNFYLAFLDGDETKMNQAAALAQDVPGAEDWMEYSRALLLARSGRLRMARETVGRAMDLARQSDQPERAATYKAGQADWEALAGDASDAKKDAAAALKSSRGRDVEYAAALALAVAGDYSRARSIANDLEKRFPEDTSVKLNYLPALRGLFALHDGSPEHAIELLQPAVAYEFAVPSVDFNTFFGGLNPIWVRGQAYLAEHKGAEAAAEFQKMIDHRGLLGGDPIGALARLELGRAYAITGDRTRAKMAFQDFLSLWKDADPEIPIYKQAKGEYARLQ